MPTTDDYLGLIPPFNRDKAKFTASIETLVEPFAALQTLMAGLPRDFDLDQAIGAQLDKVGEWVGRSRFIPLPIPGVFFSFDNDALGFDLGVWKGPYDSDSGLSRLDDDTYRLLLRAKIAANNFDGTVAGAQAALSVIFTDPETLFFVQDNGDMTVTFGVSGKIPSILLLALFSGGFIPLKPEGVRAFQTVTSVNDAPLFGFDVENDFVSGFDTGAWGVPASSFST